MGEVRDEDRPLHGLLVDIGFVPERIVVQAASRGVAIARRGEVRELVTIVAGAIDGEPLRERPHWDLPLDSATLVQTADGRRTVIVEALPAGEPSTAVDMRARRPPCALALVEAVWSAHAEAELIGPIVPELVFIDPASLELVGVAQRPLRAEAAATPVHGEPGLYGVATMTPSAVHGRAEGPADDVFRIATILWRWRHGADPLGGGTAIERLAVLSGGLPEYATSAAGRASRDGATDRLDVLLVQAMALDPALRPTVGDLLWVLTDNASW